MTDKEIGLAGTTAVRDTSRAAAEAMLVSAAVGWGLGFALMKPAVAAESVLVVLWMRFALAALLVLPFCRNSIRHWSWRSTRVALLLGTILFAAFVLFIAGLQRTTAANTGLLAGLCVVWVPLLGWLFFRKPVGGGVAVGIALCLGGLWLLSGGRASAFGLGDALVVAGSVCGALQIIAIDRYAGGHDVAGLTLIQLATVAVLSYLASAWFPGPSYPASFDMTLVVAVGVTAAVSTSFAFWVQTRFQRFTTPTRAALVFNLEPVFSTLFACVLLSEAVGLNTMLACALIVAGMGAASVWPAGRDPA